MADDTAPEAFEIGLVMAGAVSAGAYTAGVLDFLIEALEAWQKTKDDIIPKEELAGPVPRHEVRLKAMTGASAGGICLATLAVALRSGLKPCETLPAKGQPAPDNPLYNVWVPKTDVRSMLCADDLAMNQTRLPSLLDSTVLDRLTLEALRLPPRQESLYGRDYIGKPLRLALTVSNLRGVPYEVPFAGPSGKGLPMMRHADAMSFYLGKDEDGSIKDALWLDPKADPSKLSLGKPPTLDDDPWRTLGLSALATSAFPGAFRARTLVRPARDYDHLTWEVPLQVPETDAQGNPICTRTVTVPTRLNRAAEYRFANVDGGLLNNEPFELAQRMLGGDDRSNGDGNTTWRAVVMIDPFTDAPPPADGIDDENLIDVLTHMLGAMKAQTRFKPDALAQAQNPDDYSRFLIAPVRKSARGADEPNPIACGSLGAFGGFLSEDFRRHDFMLGRRNCQRFLQYHFTLPATAQLFRSSKLSAEAFAEAKAIYSVRSPGDAKRTGAPRTHLPIIPLVLKKHRHDQEGDPDHAPEPVPLSPWPQLSEAELEPIGQAIGERFELVTRRILPDEKVFWHLLQDQAHKVGAPPGAGLLRRSWVAVKGFVARLLVCLFGRWVVRKVGSKTIAMSRKHVEDKSRDTIRKALQAHGLMPEDTKPGSGT